MREKLCGEQRINRGAIIKTVQSSLDDNGVKEAYPIGKYSADQNARRRSTKINLLSGVSRPFWDLSLKSKGILTNSPPLIESPSLPIKSCTSDVVRNFLPKISSSTECISSFDFSSRYPRRQQRPSSFVSGHHALLLHHREILEASRKAPIKALWRRSDHKKVNLTHVSKEHLNLQYRDLIGDSDNLLRNYGSDGTLPGEVRVHRQCSQAETSMAKANKKCMEWFSTWTED